MKELVIVDNSRARDRTKVQVLDLKQAVEEKYLRSDVDIEAADLKQLSEEPPNLALNVKGSTASPSELWFWAVVGIVLQLICLIVPAMGTYYWQWSKGDRPVSAYAYPCFATGTIAVVLGLAVCSHVIEGSTTERQFTKSYRKGELIRGVLRLQKSCIVSDQRFSSYAILSPQDDTIIRTSRLNSKTYR